MDYSSWDESAYLIEGGSLNLSNLSNLSNLGNFNGVISNDKDQSGVANQDGSSAEEYRYKDLISKAYKQYTALGNLMVKKDAAITFTAIGAIGVSLLCINSLIVRILYVAVATILSFDIELQIPCASILLSIFVFRDYTMGLSKALLLIISLIVLVYAYWADSLANYSEVIWWMNIFVVALWVWLLFNSSNTRYYRRIFEFEGGDVNEMNDREESYDSVSDYDKMSQC